LKLFQIVLTSVVALFCWLFVPAQTGVWETGAHYGRMVRNHPDLPPVTGNSGMIELTRAIQTSGKKPWQAYYRQPQVGLTATLIVVAIASLVGGIFGKGGGEAFAAEVDMPFLGSIPLDPAVRERSDDGEPIVLDEESDTGNAFREFVETTANNQGIVHRRRHSQRN
jgi:hypothetical protein